MIPPLFKKAVYAKRRAKLLESLVSSQDLVIFFTAPEVHRNNDSVYRFRPDSSFLYLTGFAEPESALLLWKEGKGKSSKIHTHLFVQPRDRALEQWTGYRYGVEGALEHFQPDQCLERKLLEGSILKWLSEVPLPGQSPRIFSNVTSYPAHKIFLDRVLEKFRPSHRAAKKAISALCNVSPLVENQRLIKDAGEIKIMREASRINVAAHLAVMHGLKASMWEYEVQALVENEYQKQGCLDPSYTSICASGANATVLHYVENSERLKKGDLFLIDAGCEYNFYASDITRTLPIGGKYSKKQRDLMEIVADALAEATQQARPGSTVKEVHATAEKVLIEGLKSLGILKGSLAQILEKKKHKRYYPHGTSHWLGMDVHDACPYYDDEGADLKLEPGMILTVEPGLYFMKDDTTVAPAWRGLGVRIEDDVLVTETEPEVLTADLPRRASEIEAEMLQK